MIRMLRNFTLEYWKDGDLFVGRLYEVPSVFSQGETLDELEENVRDAFKMMVEEADALPVANVERKDIGVEV